MVKLIFIRGTSAVGKTTISKEILKRLKLNHKKDCAFISEDNFRKEMQYKYKSSDLKLYENSFELIKTTILKLLELDSYNIIVIEGLFRYKEVFEKYLEFVKENNFKYKIFHLECEIEEIQKRNRECKKQKEETIIALKKEIDSNKVENSIIINTNKPIIETSQEIINIILEK